jgi:Flp pilus assembly protein TadD
MSDQLWKWCNSARRGVQCRSLASGVLLLLLSCATQRPAPPPAAPGYDDFLNQGTVALGQGRYEEAVQQLEKAIALRPDSARAHNFLGMAYEQRKQYELAKERFEKAIAIDPSFPSAYNNLGGVLSLEGRWEDAVPLFHKALGLAPGMVAAHYNLGHALLATGQVEQACTYLLKAITLDPDFLGSGATVLATAASPTLGEPATAFLYASLFASTGNVEKTVEYLAKARSTGFVGWRRINEDKEFEKVREDPRVVAFLRR